MVVIRKGFIVIEGSALKLRPEGASAPSPSWTTRSAERVEVRLHSGRKRFCLLVGRLPRVSRRPGPKPRGRFVSAISFEFREFHGDGAFLLLESLVVVIWKDFIVTEGSVPLGTSSRGRLCAPPLENPWWLSGVEVRALSPPGRTRSSLKPLPQTCRRAVCGLSVSLSRLGRNIRQCFVEHRIAVGP